MNHSGERGLTALFCASILLAGCALDPAREKTADLNDGVKYLKAARYDEAIIEFRKSVQIDPLFAPAHYQLARAYQATGNTDGAYREFSQTVALDDANRDAQFNL